MRQRIQLASSKELAFLTKIIEGAGHLATVKTISGQEALAEILCSAEQWPEIERLLSALQKEGDVTILSTN